MRLYIIALLCVTSLVACKRQKPEPPPPPPPVDVNAKEPTLAEMNEAIQVWFTSRGRPPENLEDLAKAHFISKVPTPPAGRQYVIDKEKLRVVLQ